MRKFFVSGALPALICMLSACGGGTTPPTVTPPPPPVASISYSDHRKDIAKRIEQITPFSDNYSKLSHIPTSGGAQYNGYLYGVIKDSNQTPLRTLVSIAKVDVKFNGSSLTVSGAAQNFKNELNESVAGKVTFSDGSLNRNGTPTNDATLKIAAAGDIQDSELGALSLGLQLEGDFFGVTQTSIGGHALGKAKSSSKEHQFDGGFILKK